MSIDSILRAIGALACVYTIGLFVAVTSTAALNAAAYGPGTLCAEAACSHTAHRAVPTTPPDYAYSRAIHTAALFLAGE
jgi:hypothetical protein